MINILLDPKQPFSEQLNFIKNAESKIIEIREIFQETDKILINFISNGQKENRINGASGVNIFSYRYLNPISACYDIRSYWKSLVMESVKVKIEIQGSQFLWFSNMTDWKVSDFTVMEKKMYGIPSLTFS